MLYRDRDPLPLLANMLVVLSTAVTILSSEAVGVRLGGRCKADDFRGCYLSVGVFLGPARALQVLLAVQLGMVACAGLFLWRCAWCSGVAMPQGSLAATAALMQSEGVRTLFAGLEVREGKVEEREVIERCEGYRFVLGYFLGEKKEYGVVAVRFDRGEENAGPSRLKARRPPMGSRPFGVLGKGKLFNTLPLSARSLIQRSASRCHRMFEGKFLECGGLVYMAGLIILVTYYTAIQDPGTAFERFMNSQVFGVRVLFTAFGVVLTSFWNRYYTRAYNPKIKVPGHDAYHINRSNNP